VLATNGRTNRVPYQAVAQDTPAYVSAEYIPAGVSLTQPRNMLKNTLLRFFAHMMDRQQLNGPHSAFRFRSVKRGGKMFNAEYATMTAECTSVNDSTSETGSKDGDSEGGPSEGVPRKERTAITQTLNQPAEDFDNDDHQPDRPAVPTRPTNVSEVDAGNKGSNPEPNLPQGLAPRPTQPAPRPTQPAPQPKQPAPRPTQPAPQPKQPAPRPTQPAPQPKQPAPQPTQPAPRRTRPAPRPTRPAPAGEIQPPHPAQSAPLENHTTYHPTHLPGPADSPRPAQPSLQPMTSSYHTRSKTRNLPGAKAPGTGAPKMRRMNADALAMAEANLSVTPIRKARGNR
jgi:hypothetical protein